MLSTSISTATRLDDEKTVFEEITDGKDRIELGR